MSDIGSGIVLSEVVPQEHQSHFGCSTDVSQCHKLVRRGQEDTGESEAEPGGEDRVMPGETCSQVILLY